MRSFFLYITIFFLAILRIDSICNATNVDRALAEVDYISYISENQKSSSIIKDFSSAIVSNEIFLQSQSIRNNQFSRVKQVFPYFSAKKIAQNFNNSFNIYLENYFGLLNIPTLSLGYKSLVLRL